MRLRLFVGMWALLVLVVGATVVVADVLDLGEGDDPVGGGSNITRPEGADGSGGAPGDGGEPMEVLRPGQHRLTGAVTAVHLEGAVLEPRALPVPLTVVSDRGFGNGGELTGVTVDGQPSTIVWDGGRPFVLSGGRALVPEPAVVDLVPDGLRVALGGGAHALEPGRYQLDTPVAVGQAGIATPRDAVAFDAGAEARFEARGDAAVVLGTPVRLLGPGLVRLAGTLEVTGAEGPVTGSTFEVARAAFDLTFTPDGTGGWRIEGLVDETGVPG
ncbi:MAG: hypothetical protein ACLGI8_02855 [Acidimicrobiia bacterium]